MQIYIRSHHMRLLLHRDSAHAQQRPQLGVPALLEEACHCLDPFVCLPRQFALIVQKVEIDDMSTYNSLNQQTLNSSSRGIPMGK